MRQSVLCMMFSLCFIIWCAPLPAQEDSEPNQAPFNLGEIVVTGTKTPHMLEDVPVQTRVITREDIEKAGVQKIADLLRTLPGVHISGGAPGAVASRSTPLLRGLPAQYTLVLIDGQRRFKTEHIHTGVNLNLIPIDMIERVEIVDGPASALYGSDAMAGVVNIITRKAGDTEQGAAGFSAGNHESMRENLMYTVPAGSHVRHLFNVNRSESNGVNANWFERTNYQWRYHTQPSHASTVDLDMQYYSGHSYKGEDNRTDISALWVLDRPDKPRWELELSESHYSNYKPTNNDASGVSIRTSAAVGNQHLVSAGMSWRDEDFERLASPRHKQTIRALYIQDEYFLGDRFSAAAALRAEDITSLSTEYNPSLSMLYQFSPDTRLRVSAARGYKAPSLQEMYEVHYDHKTYVRDGNSSLAPEISRSISVGLERLVSRNLLWRIAFHRDDFDNMISVRDTGVVYSTTDRNDYAACPAGHTCVPIRQRQNIASAWSKGVTTEWMLKLGTYWTLDMGYAWLKTRDDTTARQLDYTPENSFSFRLGWQRGPWGAQLRGEGVKDRVYRSGTTYYDMDNYATLGSNIWCDIKPGTRVFLTVENLLDETFETFEEGKQPGQFERSYYFGVNTAL